MLSSQHFYHRITRKLVVAFGSMFNNIRLVRYNKAGTQEIERITVPLSYSSKEKFYNRITQDPNLDRNVLTTLPRITFELTGISYDPLRKISSHIDNIGISSGGVLKKVKSTPYNFEFTLMVYVRNTEDGTQIIEQILPYFSPDYTVTINLNGLSNLKVDVPIILNNITYEVSGDTGPSDLTRVIMWTMTFTAKGYLYGYISDGNSSLITKVVANTFIDTSLGGGEKSINLENGSGNFKLNELVYEGRTISAANATAFVKSWNSVANNLVIYDTNGVLKQNTEIRGAISGAKWNIASLDIVPGQVTELTVEPDPPSANVDDDYGFTITVEEYPDIT